MDTESTVVTRGLWRSYGSGQTTVHALRGVDLRIQRGDLVALVGPSGSGKSTLLHLLGGLDRPTRGEIEVAGQRLDTLGESARAILRRRTVGFVFQTYNLVPTLSVADNIELPGLLCRRRRPEVRRRRAELLEALGMSDRAEAIPTQLSGGQQQRVAIARALINTPAVLLADEPTGNLDSVNGAQVLALLEELNRDGQTIVLVTHDPLVASRASRVLCLRDGQLVDEFRPGTGMPRQAVLERVAGLRLTEAAARR